MADSNAAIYRAALHRANADDLPGYLDVYSDDAVFGGVTPEPMDKAGVVAFHENFYSAFPGTQVEALDLVESDDRIAARPFATASASSAGPRPTCSAC
jgi:ketosteroid isomerase-like protein